MSGRCRNCNWSTDFPDGLRETSDSAFPVRGRCMAFLDVKESDFVFINVRLGLERSIVKVLGIIWRSEARQEPDLCVFRCGWNPTLEPSLLHGQKARLGSQHWVSNPDTLTTHLDLTQGVYPLCENKRKARHQTLQSNSFRLLQPQALCLTCGFNSHFHSPARI